MGEPGGNIFEFLGRRFQCIGGLAFRLFRLQMQFLCVFGTALSRAVTNLGDQIVMFVGKQQRRHQQHAGFAHLTHGTQHLARLDVDMRRQFLEVRLLAVIAGDGLGATIDHHIY